MFTPTVIGLICVLAGPVAQDPAEAEIKVAVGKGAIDAWKALDDYLNGLGRIGDAVTGGFDANVFADALRKYQELAQRVRETPLPKESTELVQVRRDLNRLEEELAFREKALWEGEKALQEALKSGISGPFFTQVFSIYLDLGKARAKLGDVRRTVVEKRAAVIRELERREGTTRSITRDQLHRLIEQLQRAIRDELGRQEGKARSQPPARPRPNAVGAGANPEIGRIYSDDELRRLQTTIERKRGELDAWRRQVDEEQRLRTRARSEEEKAIREEALQRIDESRSRTEQEIAAAQKRLAELDDRRKKRREGLKQEMARAQDEARKRGDAAAADLYRFLEEIMADPTAEVGESKAPRPAGKPPTDIGERGDKPLPKPPDTRTSPSLPPDLPKEVRGQFLRDLFRTYGLSSKEIDSYVKALEDYEAHKEQTQRRILR